MGHGMLQAYRLLARYNQAFNARLYDATAQLAPALQSAPLGAYFGSILGTLNHLLVADTIWLRRFAGHPARFASLAPLRTDARPLKLDQTLHGTLEPLRDARCALDDMILALVAELAVTDLDTTLAYANSRGESHHRHFGSLLLHFFNHQTHHRGQVTTLLHQNGVDPGVTDLLAIIPTIGPERQSPA